ncbi:hypothetical protein LQL77_31940 [Rhodococcus cerastii]|nr:hypothetical protein [Rhodococcus cerastii]
MIAVPIVGPLAWIVAGDNPARREWILIPVIATAAIVFGGAIAVSVRDYGWPTEPPHRIEVGGRTYLTPYEQPEPPEAGNGYRNLGAITPVPPFGRFPVLAHQGSTTPTIVYM